MCQEFFVQELATNKGDHQIAEVHTTVPTQRRRRSLATCWQTDGGLSAIQWQYVSITQFSKQGYVLKPASRRLCIPSRNPFPATATAQGKSETRLSNKLHITHLQHGLIHERQVYLPTRTDRLRRSQSKETSLVAAMTHKRGDNGPSKPIVSSP